MRPHPLLLAALLLGTSLPSAAFEPPACRYDRVARLPLAYTGPSLQITTGGSINGKLATLLVDTGADEIFLTDSGAARYGLKLRNTNTEARGVGGKSWIYQARVEQFGLGPASIGKSYMRVLDNFGRTPSFDGVAGAPFLLQADLEISLATKELNFFRPTGCDDKFLGYWDPAAVVIPFTSGKSARSNPHFPVRINGVEVDAIIDSGADNSSISLQTAKRLGVNLDGARRLGDISGVGSQRVAHWDATLGKIEIGTESVEHAQVSVVDHNLKVELILGADFLRAHRVLFAMSQNKIYLSYVGGDPFGQRRKLEAWMLAEAEAGNADAQFALANAYLAGRRVPRSEAQARVWLEKAAANGSPHANIRSGRNAMLRGDMAEATQRLRAGLDKLPGNREAALWLHLARLHSGQAELARTELAAAFAQDDGAWPHPVAQLYLGQASADDVLKLAAREQRGTRPATCFALAAIAEWHAARGEQAQVQAVRAQGRAQCAPGRAEDGADGPG
jgi:predicted aspartyl protease/thioredoxin-like negative regulator of GroEL